MNKELQRYARETLKEQLKQCTELQQNLFKRMYSHDNQDLSIEQIVDNMEESKLDWAMQQVERTLSKIQEEN